MGARAIHFPRGARPRTILLIALPAVLILLGALMRTPVLLSYQGPPNAHLLNVDLMAHVGGYSDICQGRGVLAEVVAEEECALSRPSPRSGAVLTARRRRPRRP
jgi:hypothetical protein